MVLAEPTYILIAMGGINEGHEIVRRATLKCGETGKKLYQVLQEEEPQVWEVIKEQMKKITGMDGNEFYARPELYRGKTVEKTLNLVKEYRRVCEKIAKEL
jgi:hypothetical protein